MVEHSIFGAADGRLVVYFHGAPGSMAEAQVLHPFAKQHGLKVLCQDRFSIDASITGEAYFQILADDITSLANGGQVDIIGFSIGAFVALQVSRCLPGRVRSLHLISSAAPLEGGDFLKSMAGGRVFLLAQNLPMVFTLLSYWQKSLASFFPKLLFKMLFSSVVAGDKKLVEDDDFRRLMTGVLRDCFCGKIRGYLRDVQAYVMPWHSSLKDVSARTQLWHGDLDNWSPKAMSTYLQQQMPNCLEIRPMPGLSHYSTLYAAAPLVCQQLDEYQS